MCVVLQQMARLQSLPRVTFVTLPLVFAMRRWLYLSIFGGLMGVLSCRSAMEEPISEPPTFSIWVHNHTAAVEVVHAAFLADEEGRVWDFRWLPARDTVRLSAPKPSSRQRFDCTVFRMTAVVAPGSGVRDTAVHLLTYTGIDDGTTVHVRESLPTAQYVDVHLSLRDVQSLDSIAVPDGLPFAVPQPDNGFRGQYRVFHTGAFWIYLKANGEMQWRYGLFEAAAASEMTIERSVLDLPFLSDTARFVRLPFLAPWKYRVDRGLDMQEGSFLPLGPQIPVPGGVVPIFDAIAVREPLISSGEGYRLQLDGFDVEPGGYGYRCDRWFATLPASAPPLSVDVLPTLLSDNRLVAAIPVGEASLLRFTRRGPPNVSWEVLAEPATGKIIAYRLPDVPAALGNLSPTLKNYSFGGTVEVEVEQYEALRTYSEVLRRYLQADDPLWQMRAGLTARRRIF